MSNSASQAAIASIALGLALALSLLIFLPVAFADASRQRGQAALLLAGLIVGFILEKCGAHRRVTLAMPGRRASPLMPLSLAFADGFLISAILFAAPAAGLRLAHGAALQLTARERGVRLASATAGAALALMANLDRSGLALVLVLVSSKLLYVAIGELIPYLHTAMQLAPIPQISLVALGIVLGALPPFTMDED